MRAGVDRWPLSPWKLDGMESPFKGADTPRQECQEGGRRPR